MTTIIQQLYPHQKEAINLQQPYKKCLVNMWCGTGKTRTFTVDLLDDCKKMNVIVLPYCINIIAIIE